MSMTTIKCIGQQHWFTENNENLLNVEWCLSISQTTPSCRQRPSSIILISFCNKRQPCLWSVPAGWHKKSPMSGLQETTTCPQWLLPLAIDQSILMVHSRSGNQEEVWNFKKSIPSWKRVRNYEILWYGRILASRYEIL